MVVSHQITKHAHFFTHRCNNDICLDINAIRQNDQQIKYFFICALLAFYMPLPASFRTPCTRRNYS